MSPKFSSRQGNRRHWVRGALIHGDLAGSRFKPQPGLRRLDALDEFDRSLEVIVLEEEVNKGIAQSHSCKINPGSSPKHWSESPPPALKAGALAPQTCEAIGWGNRAWAWILKQGKQIRERGKGGL